MKKLVLLRLRFNLSPLIKDRLTPSWINEQLDIFMNYCYPCILKQSNQSFIFLLEHDPASTPILHDRLSSAVPDTPILLTSNFTETVDSLLQDYDMIYLVNVGMNLLLSHDFIEKLHLYVPEPSSRILTLQTQYTYNPLNHMAYELLQPSPHYFIFICPVTEYLSHFRAYNMFYPYTLNANFKTMPGEILTSPTCLLLTYIPLTTLPSHATSIPSKSIDLLLNNFF